MSGPAPEKRVVFVVHLTDSPKATTVSTAKSMSLTRRPTSGLTPNVGECVLNLGSPLAIRGGYGCLSVGEEVMLQMSAY